MTFKTKQKMSFLKKIRHEWRLLLIAIQFLTRIPLQLKTYEPEFLHQSSRHFPAVGLLIGILCVVVLLLCDQLFNPLVSVIIMVVFSIFLTGALHERGLADTCDALGSRVTRERALTIMKDPRLGTYGTLGLICALLLKINLLIAMNGNTRVIALILAHSVSRLLSTFLVVLLPYGGDIEHVKAKPMAHQMIVNQWLVSSLWLLPVFFLVAYVDEQAISVSDLQWFGVLVFVAIGFIYMYHLLKRRLGGYTGDGLGATQQVVEIAIYAGLAISPIL